MAVLFLVFFGFFVYSLGTHQLATWRGPLSWFIEARRIMDLKNGSSSRSGFSGFLDDAPLLESENSLPRTVVVTTAPIVVQTNAMIVRTVDGDTLVVKYDGQESEARVRLLGINTPEVVDPRKPVECFGKEASAHMHAILDGKRIRLDEDPQADNIDKYGRLLRNVVLSDGTDVNAAMVRDGYAYAYLSFPLNPARKQELKKLENDARMAQRGLWSPMTCRGQK